MSLRSKEDERKLRAGSGYPEKEVGSGLDLSLSYYGLVRSVRRDRRGAREKAWCKTCSLRLDPFYPFSEVSFLDPMILTSQGS